MQNTFTLGVVCIFEGVYPPISATYTLFSFFLFFSYPHCCCPPFSPPHLLSLVCPHHHHLLLLLHCSLFLSPAAVSLKVSFTPSSAVRSLFGNRLPPGQKLYSSLCLPVRLHLCSPPSIFLLYPLSFTPFHFFFHLLSYSDNRFQDPSIENPHLLCLPLSSFPLILSPSEFCPGFTVQRK